MTRKQRIDFDSRKEMILEASLEVFADKGISATTKELALAAGVSEALIYKHFESKEELFEQVKERCCAQVHEFASKIKDIGSPFERVTVSVLLLNHSVLCGFDEDEVSKNQIHKLVLHSLTTKGEFALQMFGHFGRWVPRIADSMKEAREQDYLQQLPSSDERLLWMVYHFVLGVALTRVPEVKMEIFDIDQKQLVFEMSVQSLVMLGASQVMAREAIEKVYKNSKEMFKEFSFL